MNNKEQFLHALTVAVSNYPKGCAEYQEITEAVGYNDAELDLYQAIKHTIDNDEDFAPYEAAALALIYHLVSPSVIFSKYEIQLMRNWTPMPSWVIAHGKAPLTYRARGYKGCVKYTFNHALELWGFECWLNGNKVGFSISANGAIELVERHYTENVTWEPEDGVNVNAPWVVYGTAEDGHDGLTLRNEDNNWHIVQVYNVELARSVWHVYDMHDVFYGSRVFLSEAIEYANKESVNKIA